MQLKEQYFGNTLKIRIVQTVQLCKKNQRQQKISRLKLYTFSPFPTMKDRKFEYIASIIH